MVGFIYRQAMGLKDFGERRRIGICVRLGLAIRDWVGRFPANLNAQGGKHGAS